MQRIVAILMALVIALPGSAGASMGSAGQDTELLRQYAGKLAIGSLVKVRLRDGEKLRGILMAVDRDQVIVKPKTRIPEPERRFPFADVEMIELEERDGISAAKAAGIGIASGVGSFLGLILVITAIFDD